MPISKITFSRIIRVLYLRRKGSQHLKCTFKTNKMDTRTHQRRREKRAKDSSAEEKTAVFLEESEFGFNITAQKTKFSTRRK